MSLEKLLTEGRPGMSEEIDGLRFTVDKAGKPFTPDGPQPNNMVTIKIERV